MAAAAGDLAVRAGHRDGVGTDAGAGARFQPGQILPGRAVRRYQGTSRALAGPFPDARFCPDRRHRRGQRGVVAGRAQRVRGGRFWLCPAADIRSGNWSRHNRHLQSDHEIAETGVKFQSIMVTTLRAKTGRTTMTASIVGWAHTPFGKFDTETVREPGGAASPPTRSPMPASPLPTSMKSCSGISTAGFSPQDFTASLVLQADPALRFKPATRVENACATGSAAVHQGIRAIARRGEDRAGGRRRADDARRRRPRSAATCCAPPICRKTATRPAALPACSARSRRAYFQKYGDQSDALAMIAAKNHKNGVANPYAQMRKDFGYEFCRAESEKNPFVAGPLKRTDCSLVSDGAAALVLTDAETAKTDGQGGQRPRHRARAGFPADVEARHSCSSKAARWPGSARCSRPA